MRSSHGIFGRQVNGTKIRGGVFRRPRTSILYFSPFWLRISTKSNDLMLQLSRTLVAPLRKHVCEIQLLVYDFGPGSRRNGCAWRGLRPFSIRHWAAAANISAFFCKPLHSICVFRVVKAGGAGTRTLAGVITGERLMWRARTWFRGVVLLHKGRWCYIIAKLVFESVIYFCPDTTCVGNEYIGRQQYGNRSCALHGWPSQATLKWRPNKNERNIFANSLHPERLDLNMDLNMDAEWTMKWLDPKTPLEGGRAQASSSPSVCGSSPHKPRLAWLYLLLALDIAKTA